ncbi:MULTISPECIES: 1-acyl-sn-glycerol-3-phosphate acyltransferase [unclassified Devosia]|mgnify:CR=1 FL=1|uniref:lysophospholipid acyltransferase family protein n=1 Tax=unclassified Devosia TaxID=196773 RepID=UPI001AC6AE3A|nr:MULTISPECIES: lysophospholipid acyltransferase family protein [unclassified Devosia]MBN9305865.1 1-acyl-sn-glycerol-3-phosphate acyltransferase [Devosia sp.]
MAAVQAIRTAVFYLLFMGQTIVLAIIVGLIAMIWRRRTAASWALATYWRNSNVAFLRWIVGVRTEVTGAENIPPGACIIAAKHQSDWDIFAILPHTNEQPAFIAKKELIDIPFFGQAARSINTIPIDRKLGAQAIPQMLAAAGAALERGCRIVIYPEGTRKKPLADPDYRQGVTRLYEALGVPVVPVALDSGLYWGKLGPIIWPGTARARFLPAIQPGLSAAVFAAQLQGVIEAETTRLIAEAVAQGVARPLGAEFRARLAARTQAAGASAS